MSTPSKTNLVQRVVIVRLGALVQGSLILEIVLQARENYLNNLSVLWKEVY